MRERLGLARYTVGALLLAVAVAGTIMETLPHVLDAFVGY